MTIGVVDFTAQPELLDESDYHCNSIPHDWTCNGASFSSIITVTLMKSYAFFGICHAYFDSVLKVERIGTRLILF